MAGKRLLIVGGAGFLGYYLVQSVLHWNRSATRPDRRHRVRQLHPRRAGVAVGPRWRPRDLDARQARHQPAPARGHGRLSIHRPRRLDCLADLLPQVSRSRRWTPTSTGCAACWTTRKRQHDRRPPVGASCSSRAARSTATPTPEPSRHRRPTGATSPAPARGPATTSRSATARPCASIFAEQHGLPIKVARPFNNYGPGLKITDRRVLPDFARDVFASRDIVMLSDGTSDAHVLLRRRRRRRLLQGAGRRPARRGLQHRRRDARDLDGRSRREGRGPRPRAVRLRGQGRHKRRRGLPRRQPERRCPVIAKARPSWATSRPCSWTKDFAARSSGIRATGTRRRPRCGFRSSAPATSAWSPAPASPTSATT